MDFLYFHLPADTRLFLGCDDEKGAFWERIGMRFRRIPWGNYLD